MVCLATVRRALPRVPDAQEEGQTVAIEPGDLGAIENPQDTSSVTTVKEYAIVPGERLPPVKGTSAYKPLEDNTVRFALNVWAGWGPIILANNGAKAGQRFGRRRRQGIQGRAGA